MLFLFVCFLSCIFCRMKLLALLLFFVFFFLYSIICYNQDQDVKTRAKQNMKNKIYCGGKRNLYINNINKYLNTAQHT